MNQKLQKVIRELERTTAKISELQAILPELERQKTELENTEIIKVFRSADVAPADFATFIAAYKAQATVGAPDADTAPQAPGYLNAAPLQNQMEESEDD